MQRRKRRSVDWRVTTGDDSSRARLALPSTHASELVRITSALLSNPSVQTVDHVLRESVEFAREVIRLERAAIYLVGPGAQSMMGTWGTDAKGRTTDEHDLMFALDEMVRQFFARSTQGHPWLVYENCPMVTHESGRSRVIGQGWLACTAITGGAKPIGILYNDTAITRAPLDEAKQARAAVLCSLLGRALEGCRSLLWEQEEGAPRPRHPVVDQAMRLLARDPSLAGEELARRLQVNEGHLTRIFRRFAGASIVDYRNELRLAQFLSRVTRYGMLEAALGAGFGSYAQFHRVFRARFGKGPRAYLFEHHADPDAKLSARPKK
jgi:AraC-like DNA-binding protein